jgi:hypothetical protein
MIMVLSFFVQDNCEQLSYNPRWMKRVRASPLAFSCSRAAA